ncbi:hypothetical protein RYX36_012542, partial [Vicia faba]
MENDDCDLFSIVNSCKATTCSSPTIVFENLPPPQTLTSYFDDSRGTNNYSNIYNIPLLFEQQQIQLNHNNQVSALKPPTCIEITTSHFDLAYNQLPTLQTHTSSMILPNTQPQEDLCKQRKSVEKIRDDPWEWRKYGQKPIKGSPHP